MINTLSKETTQNGWKKLTFGDRKFGVQISTYTWQGGEGKYHTNQGNKSNNNAKKNNVKS
jgi:hypothetical protein